MNNRIPKIVTAIALILSSVLWCNGFLRSPLLHGNPTQKHQQPKFAWSDSLEYQAEKNLAKMYWLRYPDVKNSGYWGPDGPLGILGPRNHYEQYGRDEGRIFLIVQPKSKT